MSEQSCEDEGIKQKEFLRCRRQMAAPPGLHHSQHRDKQAQPQLLGRSLHFLSLFHTHHTIPFSHALSGRSKTQPPARHLSWGRAGESKGHAGHGWGLPMEYLQLSPAWNRGWLLLPSPVPAAPPAPPALLPTGQPQSWRHWELCYPTAELDTKPPFWALCMDCGTKRRNATLTTCQFSRWIWLLWGTLSKTSQTPWDSWKDLTWVDQSPCQIKTKCWQPLLK